MNRALRRTLLCVLLWGAAPPTAHPKQGSGDQEPGAGGSQVLLDALANWSRIAVEELGAEDLPPPYRSTLAAMDYDAWYARAVFGELVAEGGHRDRPTRAEVWVGDDQLNSARFRARGRNLAPIARMNPVEDDVPLALARDLWLGTDHAYKSSAALFGMKLTARNALGGDPPPPEWSPAPVSHAIHPAPIPDLQTDRLRAIVVEASARLRDLGDLRHGQVRARNLQGNYYLADSDGNRVVQAEGYTVIYAWADLLTPDGNEVYDLRQWVARTPEGLPSLEEIADEVEAMGRSIVARARAEPVDYYEGPVVFEATAAAELFRYLLTPELCGTPPPPEPDRTYRERVRRGPRLGRRVLPEGWTVKDDPRPSPERPVGTFAYDREGVAARPVHLVEDGRVVDLLMSRTPRAELRSSNGHARGSVQGVWEARPAVIEVRPRRNLRPRRLRRKAWQLGRDSGNERILVVRHFERQDAGDMPRPTEAVWLHPDGTETPVLDLEFQHADRRILRDIVAAAGGEQFHAWLAAWELGDRPSNDRGIPTGILAPRQLLVTEMEAVYPGSEEKPHACPPPPLAPRDRSPAPSG